MEIWGGRSLQWGCVAGRVQAISWKNYGQILHYAKPSHPVSEKKNVVFRWQKVRMRWRLAKKIPEEDSELKVFQHRSLVRMRPATLVLSCHHLQMKRITHPVQSYKCGNTVEIMDLNVRIAKENLMRRATWWGQWQEWTRGRVIIKRRRASKAPGPLSND